MTNCCVIGGAGFIGHSLVKHLKKTERNITVIGRNSSPSRPLIEGVKYRAGDYSDRYFLSGILQEVDEIINLAHTTVPQTSYNDPVLDILNNLPACVNLFILAHQLGVKKIIQVSSGGTVYGKAKYLPILENHPTNPISPYGISKLAIEKYALMYHHLHGLPVICVRPSNAYGEGQKPFAGQGFVSTAIASILENKEIILYGEHGTIRDYIHVDDVANGIIAVLEKGEIGECYNIGGGIGKSNIGVLEVISRYARSNLSDLRIKRFPLRNFDVPANILDCTKLKSATGWSPLISFEDGIQRTWNWCQQTI